MSYDKAYRRRYYLLHAGCVYERRNNMSEETVDKDFVISSLMESVEILRQEISVVRNNNRILRRVHSALRSANASLRAQVDQVAQNDELFKQFCNGDFDAKVTRPADGGLPEAGTQVESLG